MCACDFNYVCITHRGTAHDHWSEFEPDWREDEIAERFGGAGDESVEEWDA